MVVKKTIPEIQKEKKPKEPQKAPIPEVFLKPKEPSPSNKPSDVLKHYWGFESFRPSQEDIINTVINGDDVFVVAPTSFGKSSVFQVPTMCMEGITIVISTHDVDLVSKYVNKIFVMADGEIIDEGTPKEIFSNEDLIEKANLKLPIISELFKALNDENQINIENNDYPLTISEAKDKILELMKN